MKQLDKKPTEKRISPQPPVPESYLLCRDCDGSWVASSHGVCRRCTKQSSSSDFRFCLACALHDHRCQHCGSDIELKIYSC
jgi:hypothetical protein